jgi:hypothetical protein
VRCLRRRISSDHNQIPCIRSVGRFHDASCARRTGHESWDPNHAGLAVTENLLQICARNGIAGDRTPFINSICPLLVFHFALAPCRSYPRPSASRSVPPLLKHKGEHDIFHDRRVLLVCFPGFPVLLEMHRGSTNTLSPPLQAPATLSSTHRCSPTWASAMCS